MNTRIITPLLLGVICLAGCSPKVTTTLIKAKAPLEPEEEVALLKPGEGMQEEAVILETVRLKGKDYDELIGMATEKARAAGGNVLKIDNHLSPDITSPKHRVSAAVLSTDQSFMAGVDSIRITADEVASQLSLRPESNGWHFAVQGGGAYRLGRLQDNLSDVEKQHIRNLRWGFTYGADVSYFIHENLGVGFKFHNCHTEDSMPVSTTDGNGKTVNSVLEDKIDIYYIGPIATFRLPSKNRNNAFFARMGVGYEGYYDKGKALNVGGTMKGKTIGFLYEAGYDFGISKHLSVGANLTFNMAFLKWIDVNIGGQSGQLERNNDKLENISNLSLNIGLRYNL